MCLYEGTICSVAQRTVVCVTADIQIQTLAEVRNLSEVLDTEVWQQFIAILDAFGLGLVYRGDSLCNLLVSVIVLNQLVGPPLFKLALIQVGALNFQCTPGLQ